MVMTQCQEVSRPYEASRFREKNDKPQYNYPCQWKYEHEFVEASMPIGASQSPNVTEAEPNYSSVPRIIEKLDVCHNFWTGAL